MAAVSSSMRRGVVAVFSATRSPSSRTRPGVTCSRGKARSAAPGPEAFSGRSAVFAAPFSPATFEPPDVPDAAQESDTPANRAHPSHAPGRATGQPCAPPRTTERSVSAGSAATTPGDLSPRPAPSTVMVAILGSRDRTVEPHPREPAANGDAAPREVLDAGAREIRDELPPPKDVDSPRSAHLRGGPRRSRSVVVLALRASGSPGRGRSAARLPPRLCPPRDRSDGLRRPPRAGHVGRRRDLPSVSRRGGRGLARLRSPAGDATRHGRDGARRLPDRKSTRLNSSHVRISYAVFCLKK